MIRIAGIEKVAAIAGAFACATPAHADISAFNAAVQAGDYRAAITEARATWPTVDPGGADTATIAREFGWVAMLAGDPQAAQVYSRFLVEHGASLAHPDGSPAVSQVLHAWVGLGLSSAAAQRSRLLDALRLRAQAAGRDLISPRAAQALAIQAWAAGDWVQAETAAELAIRFLDELVATQSPAHFQVRRIRASAAFMRTRSPESYTDLYNLVTELHSRIAEAQAGPQRDQLAVEYYAAQAWGDTVYGALPAGRQRQVADRRFTAGAGLPSMADLLYPAPGDPTLPRCRLTLARASKTPGFPFVSQFKDFGGEVIYALDVLPGGTFDRPRVLAAAPHPDFAEASASVVASWRWKVEGPQPPACRMPDVHIITFEFALGR